MREKAPSFQASAGLIREILFEGLHNTKSKNSFVIFLTLDTDDYARVHMPAVDPLADEGAVGGSGSGGAAAAAAIATGATPRRGGSESNEGSSDLESVIESEDQPVDCFSIGSAELV